MRLTSFKCAPCAVTGGTSIVLTLTLSSPAPQGGAVVALSASSTSATIPASVTVPQGQTSASVSVATQTVDGEQLVAIQASYNGSARSVTLTLTGSRFDAFDVAPQSVVGGENTTATLSLSAPAPEEGLRVVLTSNHNAVSVPAAVAVRGGEERAAFPIVTSPVSQQTTVTIRASVEGDGRETSLTLLPAGLVAVAFDTASIHGGISASGTVTLSGPAAAQGVAVALVSESRLLAFPETVLVPPGARTATFTASATPVETAVEAGVIALLNGESVATRVRIDPPVLTSVAVTSPVVGGEPFAADVTINAPAAEGGASVAFDSTDAAVVPPPAIVQVPVGSTTARTSGVTQPVAADTPVVISASRNGVTHSATVLVTPPPVTLAAITIAPGSVVGSNDAIGTVALTAPAPQAGVEVELTSGSPAVVRVPTVVAVPPGAMQATFTIETTLVAVPETVIIVASHATTEKSSALALLPPDGNHVVALVVTPALIVSGTAASATVTLAVPSSAGGSDVALSLSAPELLSMPRQVRVHTNATSATFTLTASAVMQPNAVTITASYGGVVQRRRVIVAPENAVTLASFAIEPARVVGGAATNGVIMLTGPAPHGGAVVQVTPRRRNMITVPNTVTIPQGATSATFPIATEVVHGKTDRAVEIGATYNGVSLTATVVVAPLASAAAMHEPVARCASMSLQPCLTRAAVTLASAPSAYEHQYHLYTPELSLLAEIEASTGGTPPIAYEYIWFGGEPLAQVQSATGDVHYYYNDHLGTPILQTDANTRVVWHVEYEPYGRVHLARRGEAKHQPLRFPGQEAEAESDITYNMHRWYRAEWGRYTQSDPLPSQGVNEYSYAYQSPAGAVDPYGLWGVRHTEKVHLATHPESICGSKIACSKLIARVECACPCPNSGSEISPVPTLVIMGNIYVNPFFKNEGAASKVDPNVKSYKSALAHEYYFHIDKAIEAVTPILDDFEAERFDSVGACRTRCVQVHNQVFALFNQILSETQQWESSQP